MAFSLDNVLGVHEHSLKLRAKRTELIASNLANADTPGYKAKDIDFQTALKQATSGSDMGKMKTTHAKHISTSLEGGGVMAELIKYRVPHQPALDGNTVETNVEQAAFAKNSIEYQASLRFLESRSKGILNAIKGGQ
ncbi:flagellar basal body rod protein FlgB [Pseudomonadota bacterium]